MVEPKNPDAQQAKRLVAQVRGSNVHAERFVDGRDRPQLERLCRYLACGMLLHAPRWRPQLTPGRHRQVFDGGNGSGRLRDELIVVAKSGRDTRVHRLAWLTGAPIGQPIDGVEDRERRDHRRAGSSLLREGMPGGLVRLCGRYQLGQSSRPVRWEQSVRHMPEDGVRLVVGDVHRFVVAVRGALGDAVALAEGPALLAARGVRRDLALERGAPAAGDSVSPPGRDPVRSGCAAEEFRDQVTQTKRRSRFQDPLAQALIKRCRDNIVLALESYNRPSLVNRIDAFAMLFCTAWEQLLKAELIEAHGQEKIFRPQKPNRRRESISLDECLQIAFPDAKDPVRRNLERIAELRHAATHLVMPEIQPIYARLFQSGVLVFARRLLERTGEPLVPRQNVGLLVLIADEDTLDTGPLVKLYGDEIAAEIIAQAKTIEEEIKAVNDDRFAIPFEYKLRFATKGEEADVTLVHAAEAPANAVVFEKPVDPERTHSLRTRQLEQQVATKLKHAFSSRDLQCVLAHKGWKKSDNEFHRMQRNPDTPKFSHKAVDEIVRSIEGDPDYLRRARESYRHGQQKGRR